MISERPESMVWHEVQNSGIEMLRLVSGMPRTSSLPGRMKVDS